MKAPLLAITVSAASLAAGTDYKTLILPIVKEHCWKCHSNDEEASGGLAFDDLDDLMTSHISDFGLIRPGDPEKSDLLLRLKLDSSDEDFMPRRGTPLKSREIATIEKWIQGGAILDKENMTPEETERAARANPPGRHEFLNWTNLDGKTLEARFLGIEGESVKIVMKNGRSYVVPLATLNEDSVAQAKRLSGR